MATKLAIQQYYQAKTLWCSNCLKSLTPDTTWLPENTSDGRIFCYDCAPDDAIRAKDIS